MANSPVLDITYLFDEQNQAEIKVNEAINRLESMSILTIQDRDDTAPPSTPANGDVYIPAATATGDWAGHEDELAIYYDGWTFLDPVSGMLAYVLDEAIWLLYDGSKWIRLDTLGQYFEAIEIQDRDLNSPPGGETEGQTWLVGSSGSGAWTGHSNELAVYTEGGWIFRAPRGGMTAFVKDEKIWIGYSSQESAWHPIQRTWSSTEYWTGEYFGGSKLYAKTINVGSLPNATQTTDAHGITGLATIVKIIATADDGTDQIDFASGWDDEGTSPTTASHITLTINDTNIVIDTDFDASSFSGSVTLEYTKT